MIIIILIPYSLFNKYNFSKPLYRFISKVKTALGKALKKKKKGKELKSFYIDYVLLDSNGNTYILAEEFYITQVYISNGMNGGGYWQTTYHYDDILIMKFDNNGKLDWSRSVFKKAQSPSYNAFIKNDELHECVE